MVTHKAIISNISLCFFLKKEELYNPYQINIINISYKIKIKWMDNNAHIILIKFLSAEAYNHLENILLLTFNFRK